MLQRHALRVVVSELKNQTLKMRRKCFGDSWPEKKDVWIRWFPIQSLSDSVWFLGVFLDNFGFF